LGALPPTGSISDRGDRAIAAAMRLDFHFWGGRHAVARKVDLHLPENYAFTFRCAAPANASSSAPRCDQENVWWSCAATCVPRVAEFVIKKTQIGFAWGPWAAADPGRRRAQIVVTAGGGRGRMDRRNLPRRSATRAAAGAGRGLLGRAGTGGAASTAVDTRGAGPGDPRPGSLDLGRSARSASCSAGGRWRDVIGVADDARRWRGRAAKRGRGTCTSRRANRHVRGESPAPAAGGLLRSGRPLAWSATREAFFQAIALEARRGLYPRGMSGEQVYWTVVGADTDTKEVLFSEDGAIEAGEEHFSIEPFLMVGDTLLTWADAEVGQTADRVGPGSSRGPGHRAVPFPVVRWKTASLELHVTAFVGRAEPPIIVRYWVISRPRRSRLSSVWQWPFGESPAQFS
jgi:hypothetical protein